jgi:hypothetical protein
VKEKLVTRTVRVPVEVAGKVAYREETTTEAVTDSATDTDTNLTDTQTESKQRNIVTLGMGCDRSISPSILVGATLLGPLGVAGQVTFQTSPPAFKTGNLWATIGL